MTDQELDKVMCRILLDSLRAETEQGQDDVEPFTASRRYQRQMKAMLKDPLKWMKNKTKPIWKFAIQKIAVFLLVVSVSVGGLMAVSPPVRAAVIRWVTEWYETYVVYRYLGGDESETKPQFTITALPDGYIETERLEFASTTSVVYESGDGNVIYFDYAYMQQGTSTIIVSDDDLMISVAVNGHDGKLFIPADKESMSSVTWIDAKNETQFILYAMFGEEEILNMAESVSQLKNERKK